MRYDMLSKESLYYHCSLTGYSLRQLHVIVISYLVRLENPILLIKEKEVGTTPPPETI